MADEPTVTPAENAPAPVPVETTAPPAQLSVSPAVVGTPVGEAPEARSEPARSEPPVAPAPEPSAEPAPAEAAKPEAKPAAAPKPSLLGDAMAEAEAKAEAEPKPVEPEAAPESIHYEPFTFPEGFQVSEERLAPFTAALGEMRATQEQGQKLADLYASEVERVRGEMIEYQQTVFDETQNGWIEQFKQDPELGGNLRQTTINSVLGLLQHYSKDAKTFRAVREALVFTGAGNHPEVIRVLARAAKDLQKNYREGTVVRAGQPAPQPQSRIANRYRASANGSAG